MKDNGSDRGGGKPPGISSAQHAANRRNAQRSTGPRTPEGKQTSSQNATSHGAYAGSVHPVRSGALAENPAEVEAFIEAMVTAKNPRDEIEREIACQIANALLRHRRAGRLEAYELAHCSQVDARLDAAVYTAELLGEVLEERFPMEEACFRSMVDFIRSRRRPFSFTSWNPSPTRARPARPTRSGESVAGLRARKQTGYRRKRRETRCGVYH